jgi:hypothetical protein
MGFREPEAWIASRVIGFQGVTLLLSRYLLLNKNEWRQEQKYCNIVFHILKKVLGVSPQKSVHWLLAHRWSSHWAPPSALVTTPVYSSLNHMHPSIPYNQELIGLTWTICSLARRWLCYLVSRLLFIIRVKRELERVYRNGCRYNERLTSETGGSKTPHTHWVVWVNI